MTQVANLNLPDQLVDSGQNAGTVLRDEGTDDSTVGSLPPATDEAQQLKPIEQPRDVRISSGELVADFPAGQPMIPGGPKGDQDVVLTQRQSERLQDFAQGA